MSFLKTEKMIQVPALERWLVVRGVGAEDSGLMWDSLPRLQWFRQPRTLPSVGQNLEIGFPMQTRRQLPCGLSEMLLCLPCKCFKGKSFRGYGRKGERHDVQKLSRFRQGQEGFLEKRISNLLDWGRGAIFCLTHDLQMHLRVAHLVCSGGTAFKHSNWSHLLGWIGANWGSLLSSCCLRRLCSALESTWVLVPERVGFKSCLGHLSVVSQISRRLTSLIPQGP